MTEEYMVSKIREWARHGVIAHNYEAAMLIDYGVPPDAAVVMADADTLIYEADH